MISLSSLSRFQKAAVALGAIATMGLLLFLLPGLQESLFKANIAPADRVFVAEDSATVRLQPGNVGGETDLTITKAVASGQTEFQLGDEIEYVITYALDTVSNPSAVANNVVITDTLRDIGRVEFLRFEDPRPQDCGYQRGTIQCSLGTLDATNPTGVIRYVVLATGEGEVRNTAAITSDETDPNGVSVTVNVNIVAGTLDLSTSKQVIAVTTATGANGNINNIQVGDIITYRVGLTTDLPAGETATLTNLRLTDTFPAAFFNADTLAILDQGVFESCETGTPGLITCERNTPLTVTGGQTLNFDYSIATAQQGDNVRNDVTITAQQADPDPDNNSAFATIDIGDGGTGGSNADVSITKTVEGIANGDTVALGTELIYVLTYAFDAANSTASDAQEVTVIDTPDTTRVANITFLDGNPQNCTFDTTNGVITCDPFTLTAQNSTGVIRYSATAIGEGSATNVVTITSNRGDPDGSDNSDTFTVVIEPGDAALIVQKTIVSVDGQTPPPANANGHIPVGIGQVVGYQVTITNTGADPATGVTLTDRFDPANLMTAIDVPTGCTQAQGEITCNLQDIPGNSARSVPIYTATVSGAATPGDVIANNAVIDSNEFTPDPVSATVQVVAPAFTIAKSVTPADINNGDIANYTIRVTNTGTTTGNIFLRDELQPATAGGSLIFQNDADVQIISGSATLSGDFSGGYTFTDVAPGSVIEITYSFQADTAMPVPIDGGSTSNIPNRACLYAPSDTITPLTDEQGNALCETATVTLSGGDAGPDLAVTINVDDDTVAPNVLQPERIATVLRYTLRWFNLGNTAMNDTSVTVTCDPNSLTFLSAAGAQTIDNDTATIVWNLGDLNAGSDGPLFFEAELNDGFGDPAADLTCTAFIQSAVTPITDEVDQDNNTDTVTVNVDQGNEQFFFKRVTNLSNNITSTTIQATEGDELEYTLIFRAGDTAVPNHEFRDDVQDILQYSEIIDFGGADLVGDELVWPEQAVNAFQEASVRFRVRILDDLEGLGGDYELRNAYGNDVTVVTLPNLVRNKTVAVNSGTPTSGEDPASWATARPGDTLTYTLSVTNVGTTSRDGFVFADDITDVLEYSTVTDFGGNGGQVQENGQGQQIISWDPISIPPDSTISQTFQVQVDNPLIASGDFTMRNVYGTVVTVVTIPNVALDKSVRNVTTGQGTTEILDTVDGNSGDTITYTLSATENTGDTDFENFVFADNITDILQYASPDSLVISDDGSLANGVLSWPAVTIPAGDTITRTFTITINPANDWPVGVGFDRELQNNFCIPAVPVIECQDNLTIVRLPEGEFEVDLSLSKSAGVLTGAGAFDPIYDTQSIAIGTEFVYAITLRNDGNITATGIELRDDFEEDDISITTLPDNCELQPTNENPEEIYCTISPLDPGASRTLFYTAQVLPGADGEIFNSAQVTSTQPDGNDQDNTFTRRVTVADGGLSFRKRILVGTGDNQREVTQLDNVVGGQDITFRITVGNTSNDTQSLTITDTITALSEDSGGSLTYNRDAQADILQGDATFAGTNPFQVTLDPDSSLQITYTATASANEIPFNSTAAFRNTAQIDDNGLTDTNTVFILGPTRGGGGGGNGGGGGGSSGGGSRIIAGQTVLYVEKEVKDIEGRWQSADNETLAALVPDFARQTVEYRLRIRNEGNITDRNREIEDVFFSDQLEKIRIFNVRGEGVTFFSDRSVFLIERIPVRQEQFIYYDMEIQRLIAAGETAVGVNTVNLLEADFSDLAPRFRIEELHGAAQDSAYIRTGEITPGQTFRGVTLKKRVRQENLSVGDTADYLITMRNQTGQDIRSIVLTDLFPSELEYISGSHPGINRDGVLQFRKHILRVDDMWSIRIKARVKPGARGTIPNIVRIESENIDFSGYEARADIFVNGQIPLPNRLQNTGPEGILLVIFGMMLVGIGMKKRYA